MDSRYICNYFIVAVAGVFCWLNASVASAQTATDVTCAGCIGFFEFAPGVRTRFFAQEASINQNSSDIAALEARVEALEALVATLQASSVRNLSTYLRIDETNPQRPTAWFEAVNVMVVNGTGTTRGATNGLGNLIVGYDEFDGQPDDNKSGSHNLVVGPEHNYSSVGGFVAGRRNDVLAVHATVSGFQNTASGVGASVSGGTGNTASGRGSSVTAGRFNTALGENSSVSGGSQNQALAESSSVSGGFTRTASFPFDWVAGALFQDF